MLVANQLLKKNSPIFNQHHRHFFHYTFILVIILVTSHVCAQKNIKKDFPTHLNFLKGRKKVVWCANDPAVCLDPYANPWGGPTCCFQRYCKDIMNDPHNCGSCGRVCGFGFACCGGNCVDTRNNPLHCGACFEECPRKNACAYSMCDYGG